jgi:Zn finger protein HypA/HybF involved in hydrogenase expression
MKKEFIFKCRKCNHNIYVDKPKVGKLIGTDCPECGEEENELWILVGEGDFDELSS